MRPTRKAPRQPLDHEPRAVAYARGAAGLTQQQLADRCGVSKSLISEIEAGRRNATPAMLIKLAGALNCPKVILERKRAETPKTDEPTAEAAAAVEVRSLRDQERAGANDMPRVW